MRTEPRLASSELIELAERHGAHNYHPLPVVVAEAEGAWVTDVEGKRFLDMLAAYSALNFGHRHPDLIRAAKEQLDRVTQQRGTFVESPLAPLVTATIHPSSILRAETDEDRRVAFEGFVRDLHQVATALRRRAAS